jgi:hypothetical protein
MNDWREIFQNIVGTKKVSGMTCKVMKVSGYEVEAEPLREAPLLNDIRIKVNLENDNGITIIPVVGSAIFVVFADEDSPFIALYSDIQEIKYKINGKFTLSNTSGNLGQIIEDLIAAIEKLTVTTGVGPSGVPINLAEFTGIKTRLKNLLNTN